jgi:hypothetical protein
MGQALPIASQDFRNRHLTVVVYWKKRTGIDSLQNGHAALIIDTALMEYGKNDFYVSWLSTGASMVNRASAGTFMSDCGDWGGSAVGDGGLHIPNRWVALKGMNIGAMKEAWDQMRGKERAHWKLFDKNCATMVARILKAGGGDSFARAHQKQLMWWPTDLLRYAKSMGQNVYQTS